MPFNGTLSVPRTAPVIHVGGSANSAWDILRFLVLIQDWLQLLQQQLFDTLKRGQKKSSEGLFESSVTFQ